jgi:hypothetical protein
MLPCPDEACLHEEEQQVSSGSKYKFGSRVGIHLLCSNIKRHANVHHTTDARACCAGTLSSFDVDLMPLHASDWGVAPNACESSPG